MPSSIDVFFFKKPISEKPSELTMGVLLFWQYALTNLRKNYFTHSIKPIELPITDLKKGQAPYECNQLSLTIHAQHLKDLDGRDNIYPFVLSIQKEKVPFSILTRYLIFNKVTGYHHIFQFHQFEDTKDDKMTEHFFKGLTKNPSVSRVDFQKYLHWYFRYALRVLGDPRLPTQLTPIEMLVQMKNFWHLTGDS
jgi:hypothetical protein